MTDHPMTVALAARMCIWTILILAGMFGVAVLIGKRFHKISFDYPEPTESEDEQDFEEGTTPPRVA